MIRVIQISLSGLLLLHLVLARPETETSSTDVVPQDVQPESNGLKIRTIRSAEAQSSFEEFSKKFKKTWKTLFGKSKTNPPPETTTVAPTTTSIPITEITTTTSVASPTSSSNGTSTRAPEIAEDASDNSEVTFDINPGVETATVQTKVNPETTTIVSSTVLSTTRVASSIGTSTVAHEIVDETSDNSEITFDINPDISTDTAEPSVQPEAFTAGSSIGTLPSLGNSTVAPATSDKISDNSKIDKKPEGSTDTVQSTVQPDTSTTIPNIGTLPSIGNSTEVQRTADKESDSSATTVQHETTTVITSTGTVATTVQQEATIAASTNNSNIVTLPSIGNSTEGAKTASDSSATTVQHTTAVAPETSDTTSDSSKIYYNPESSTGTVQSTDQQDASTTSSSIGTLPSIGNSTQETADADSSIPTVQPTTPAVITSDNKQEGSTGTAKFTVQPEITTVASTTGPNIGTLPPIGHSTQAPEISDKASGSSKTTIVNKPDSSTGIIKSTVQPEGSTVVSSSDSSIGTPPSIGNSTEAAETASDRSSTTVQPTVVSLAGLSIGTLSPIGNSTEAAETASDSSSTTVQHTTTVAPESSDKTSDSSKIDNNPESSTVQVTIRQSASTVASLSGSSIGTLPSIGNSKEAAEIVDGLSDSSPTTFDINPGFTTDTIQPTVQSEASTVVPKISSSIGILASIINSTIAPESSNKTSNSSKTADEVSGSYETTIVNKPVHPTRIIQSTVQPDVSIVTSLTGSSNGTLPYISNSTEAAETASDRSATTVHTTTVAPETPDTKSDSSKIYINPDSSYGIVQSTAQPDTSSTNSSIGTLPSIGNSTQETADADSSASTVQPTTTTVNTSDNKTESSIGDVETTTRPEATTVASTTGSNIGTLTSTDHSTQAPEIAETTLTNKPDISTGTVQSTVQPEGSTAVPSSGSSNGTLPSIGNSTEAAESVSDRSSSTVQHTTVAPETSDKTFDSSKIHNKLESSTGTVNSTVTPDNFITSSNIGTLPSIGNSTEVDKIADKAPDSSATTGQPTTTTVITSENKPESSTGTFTSTVQTEATTVASTNGSNIGTIPSIYLTQAPEIAETTLTNKPDISTGAVQSTVHPEGTTVVSSDGSIIGTLPSIGNSTEAETTSDSSASTGQLTAAVAEKTSDSSKIDNKPESSTGTVISPVQPGTSTTSSNIGTLPSIGKSTEVEKTADKAPDSSATTVQPTTTTVITSDNKPESSTGTFVSTVQPEATTVASTNGSNIGTLPSIGNSAEGVETASDSTATTVQYTTTVTPKNRSTVQPTIRHAASTVASSVGSSIGALPSIRNSTEAAKIADKAPDVPETTIQNAWVNLFGNSTTTVQPTKTTVAPTILDESSYSSKIDTSLGTLPSNGLSTEAPETADDSYETAFVINSVHPTNSENIKNKFEEIIQIILKLLNLHLQQKQLHLVNSIEDLLRSLGKATISHNLCN